MATPKKKPAKKAAVASGVVCPQCGKMYSSQSGMVKHWNSAHAAPVQPSTPPVQPSQGIVLTQDQLDAIAASLARQMGINPQPPRTEPPQPTPEPSTQPQKVVVPSVVNHTENAAHAIISSAELVGQLNTESHPTVPQGRVIRQDPAAGTRVDKWTTVHYVVSLGPTPPQPTQPEEQSSFAVNPNSPLGKLLRRR